MKFNKLSLILASLFLAVGALAQGTAFDIWGGTRVTQVAKAQVLNDGAATSQTNTWVDIRNLTGIGTMVINVGTNLGAAATLTMGIESSVDQTNTTAVLYAIGTNSTAIYSNNVFSAGAGPGYATNALLATNTYIFPGTVVTPTAATAGWATPYLVPSPMTNTGTLNVAAGGTFTIGFKLDDCQRYLHVWWNPGGASSTNATVSATLISRGIQTPQ